MAENNVKAAMQRLYKGLNTDTNPVDQPEGTYRFALNAINQSRNGNVNLLSTEEGNEEFVDTIAIDDGGITHDLIIIGSIYVDDNEHFLFGVKKDKSRSAIGVLKANGTFQILVDDPDNTVLTFDPEYQITGEYRLRNGCEKTVYWVDGLNDVKSFTPSDNYYTADYTEYLALHQKWIDDGEVGIEPVKPSGNPYNVLMFNLIKGVTTIPTFDNIEVSAGGTLKSGTYNFAIQYVDSNNNATAWIATSQLVPIYKNPLIGAYDTVIGSSNAVVTPTEQTDVIYGETPTNKKIELTIGNLSNEYPFYRIAVIEAISGTGIATRVLVSSNQLTTDNLFIHDGNISKYTEDTIETILFNSVDISSAKHIEQIEDRLLLSNLKSSDKSYCSLQKFASKIRSKYIVDNVAAYDYNEVGNSKNPKTYFEKMSYMGGEVYAFGIVYIFEDGVESPAYHIPGRPKITTNDNAVIGTYTDDIAHLANNMKASDYDALPDEAKVPYWKVYETATIEDEKTGLMAFWEMSDGTYNPRDYCSGEDYWGVDGYEDSGNPIVGSKIRHHKFPNRNTIPHFQNDIPLNPPSFETAINFHVIWDDTSDTSTSYDVEMNITFEYSDDEINWITLPPIVETISSYDISWFGATTIPAVVGFVRVASTSLVYLDAEEITINGVSVLSDTGKYTTIVNWNINEIGSTDISDAIGLLGIEFDNIELPEGVVGYKIVRGARDAYNRTVLDKAYSGTLRKNNEFIGFTGMIEPEILPSDSAGGKDYGTPLIDVTVDVNNKYILSPSSMFHNKDEQPSYLKSELEFGTTSPLTEDTAGSQIVYNVTEQSNGLFDNDGYDWQGTTLLYNFVKDSSISEKNHIVNKTNYLNYITKLSQYSTGETSEVRDLYNCSFDNKVGVVNLGSQFTVDDSQNFLFKVRYVSLNVNKDVHPILDNIEYQQCKNNIDKETSSTNFGGDTFISHFPITHSMYQGDIAQVRYWDFIVKAVAAIIATVISIVATIASAGGAAAIGPWLVGAIIAVFAIGGSFVIVAAAYETFATDYENTTLHNLMQNIRTLYDPNNTLTDDTYFGVMEHYNGLFMESDINIGLRETTVLGVKGFTTNSNMDTLKLHMKNKFLVFDDRTLQYIFSYIIVPEIYQSNLDFSRENKQKIWFALPTTYECCSDCLEEFPNRIYYSEKSFIEENADSYTKFLPLNYITIPGEHGAISNIFSINNSLFAHTKSNLWYIPQNIQERITGEVVSLIGTGGFFESPPRKIFDSDVGNAGSNQKHATLKTKHGVIFIDDVDGKIYLLNAGTKEGVQIDELSSINKGMSKWFKENIPLKLYENLYDFGNYKYDKTSNPANEGGIGFITAYDAENDRLLITKKDYAFIHDIGDIFSVINDSEIYANNVILGDLQYTPIVFNTYNNQFFRFFEIPDTGWMARVMEIGDPFFFKPTGWTISYSFLSQSWTSFHNYIPRFYIFDNKNLYSITDDFTTNTYIHKVWKHNIKDTYLKYYDNDSKYIIDFIAINNPLQTSIYDSILLQTDAEKNGVEQRFTTFNKLVVYNSRQCSGELTLNNPDVNSFDSYMMESVSNVPGQINIKKKDKDWKINGFRDMRSDYSLSIFSSEWSDIQNSYYIDKVVNTAGINMYKDWTELEKFKDKYLGIRLIFDTATDVKLTTKYSVEIETPKNY